MIYLGSVAKLITSLVVHTVRNKWKKNWLTCLEGKGLYKSCQICPHDTQDFWLPIFFSFSDISSKFIGVRTICFTGETAGVLVKEWSQSFSRAKDSSWSLKISREKKSISNLCIHSKDCQWYHRRELPRSPLPGISSQTVRSNLALLAPFMHNSSVCIFFMLCTLYRMICINSKCFFCKNSLNVQNVKPLSFFFQHYWPFYAFLVRMTTCTLHIKWFPWHEEPK